MLTHSRAIAPGLLGVALLALTATASAEEGPRPPVVPPAPSEGAWPGGEPAPRPRDTEPPLAGYHGGLFYLRDRKDNFRLYPQLRGQIDSYNYFGSGVSDTTMRSTVLLRRVRPELAGEILGTFQFLVAGDFGQTGFDNPKGTNETSAAPPGAAPTASTARFGSAQTATVKAGPADVYINYRVRKELNVQAGQFNPPFTMEAVASEKTMPMLERSLGARILAVPFTKDLGAMAWGEASDGMLSYALGGFNGDGQNKPNADNRFDAMGRLVIKPLRSLTSRTREAHIGASFRYGSRDSKRVFYDAPTYTTQGGYAFFTPIYGGGAGQTHILPASLQRGVAGELRIPLGIVALTSEAVYIDNRTRESREGYEATNTERAGVFHGYSYYVQASVWLFGPTDILGDRIFNQPAHVDFSVPDPETPPQALQLLVRWEQLRVTYDSASRGGIMDKKAVDGVIAANVLGATANWWATRHMRLSAQYGLNVFPGTTGPVHTLHEVLFRVAVAL